MSLLADLPVWVYWVALGVTFMVVHGLAFRPAQPGEKGRTAKRVGSSALLLVALIVVDPSTPASVLLGLLAAAAGGYLSGRAAPPAPNG